MVVGATPQTDISWYIRWKLGKHQALSQTCWDGTNIGRIVTTVGFCTCPCKHIQQAMIPHEYVKSQLRRAVRKIETVHTKLCTLALTACMLNWGCVYFHDGLASSCFPCAHWVAQSYLEANHDGNCLEASNSQMNGSLAALARPLKSKIPNAPSTEYLPTLALKSSKCR